MFSPLEIFKGAWIRCDSLGSIYSYLDANTTNVLQTDEILRSEWVGRISALDLYVHELLAQKMIEIFDGTRPTTPQYQKFQIPTETMARIVSADSKDEARSVFEFEVRRQLAFLTFQNHESIADGVRLISTVELWNQVAIKLGANQSSAVKEAKLIKSQLSIIVERRNKIAHEADMQPTFPRDPWPINVSDLIMIRDFVSKLVFAIDEIV